MERERRTCVGGGRAQADDAFFFVGGKKSTLDQALRPFRWQRQRCQHVAGINEKRAKGNERAATASGVRRAETEWEGDWHQIGEIE